MLLRPALSTATQRYFPPTNKISSKLISAVVTIYSFMRRGTQTPQNDGLTAKYELGTMKTGTDNKRLGELGCAHTQLQYHVWKITFNSDTERISSHGHKPSETSK